jgi:hypothetical protein
MRHVSCCMDTLSLPGTLLPNVNRRSLQPITPVIAHDALPKQFPSNCCCFEILSDILFGDTFHQNSACRCFGHAKVTGGNKPFWPVNDPSPPTSEMESNTQKYTLSFFVSSVL